MEQLANCPICGQLFMKGIRSVCQACYQEEEEKFETVYAFIRNKKNRSAKMDEICEKTGVSEKTINRFVKEGRIRLSEFPNLTYPCESCGHPIREGKLCTGCKKKLRKSLDQYNQEQEFENRKQDSMRTQTYFSDKPAKG